MFQIIPNCKAVSAKLKVLPSSSECDNWSSSCGGSNFLVSELKAISIWFVGSIVFKMDLKSLKFASTYVPADFQVGIWGGAVSCHQQPFFHLWRGLWRHISETDAHATLAACRYTAWRCCVDKSQRLQEFKEPSWINADVLWAMTDVPEHESTITYLKLEVDRRYKAHVTRITRITRI